MQMVLVLGATSKVNAQLQFAQHLYQKSVQNSRTVPTSGILRTLTDLYVSRLRRRHNMYVGRMCSSFGIAGDVEYALVLVDNGSASFPGSCKHS